MSDASAVNFRRSARLMLLGGRRGHGTRRALGRVVCVVAKRRTLASAGAEVVVEGEEGRKGNPGRPRSLGVPRRIRRVFLGLDTTMEALPPRPDNLDSAGYGLSPAHWVQTWVLPDPCNPQALVARVRLSQRCPEDNGKTMQGDRSVITRRQPLEHSWTIDALCLHCDSAGPSRHCIRQPTCRLV